MQLLLAAAPSCRAARPRCALQLHSFEQLLVVVMREQLTVPWAARRNDGTHSFDSCLLMTILSSWTLQSANLARPAEGIFMRQQHNATFVPTRWRLISAMLPAASASVWSAAVKVLHSGIITSDSAIFPQKERRKREISNESARSLSLHETNV